MARLSLWPRAAVPIGPQSGPRGERCPDLTSVGSYPGSASPYGTFDQGGNVFEWNEAIAGTNRVARGGNFRTYE